MPEAGNFLQCPIWRTWFQSISVLVEMKFNNFFRVEFSLMFIDLSCIYEEDFVRFEAFKIIESKYWQASWKVNR